MILFASSPEITLSDLFNQIALCVSYSKWAVIKTMFQTKFLESGKTNLFLLCPKASAQPHNAFQM